MGNDILKRWKQFLPILAVAGSVIGRPTADAAEEFRFGGGGEPWADWTALNILMDFAADSTAIQGLELKPDENVLPRLGPWFRWEVPPETDYRPGNPRIWRGNKFLRLEGEPRDFVDGDPNTFFAGYQHPFGAAEFYTISLGGKIPVERFAFYPPEGNHALGQEPYRPNFAFKEFELSAGNEEPRRGDDATGALGHEGANPLGTGYRPLEILLSSVELNFEADVEIRFPPQLAAFLRIRFFPPGATFLRQFNPNMFPKFALAELEVYGRGFVPKATWESKVIDMGEVVNFGPVNFGLSRWRRQDDQLVPAPDAPVRGRVEVKTGLDETPIAYFGYDELGNLAEVTETQYSRLKQRILPTQPEAIGWRALITEDTSNWSFWSAPVRQSGERPRVRRGQYAVVRVTAETETLLDVARMDSLTLTASPLLAERIVGEVAAVGDLEPEGDVVQVAAGAPTDFAYDVRAEFSGADQSGFDAVRLLTPSRFLELKMGEPLEAVVPDSVVEEVRGFAVYLPRPVSPNGEERLRIQLESTIYGAAGELAAEVFEREGTDLPQEVEPGDVGPEVSTNQLRVVALASSLGSVLADVVVRPRVFTPQGDGVNDRVRIGYTLFRLNGAEVELEVFNLRGERVRQISLGPRDAGPHADWWDGRDDQRQLVEPGIYLARVGVATDAGVVQRAQAVGVAY